MRPFLYDVVPLVRLPRGVRQRYSYSFSEHLNSGQLVTVSFRHRNVIGVVMGKSDAPIGKKILDITKRSPFGELTSSQQSLVQVLMKQYGASETVAFGTIVGRLPLRDVSLSTATPERFPKKKVLSSAQLSLYDALVKTKGITILSGSHFSPQTAALEHLMRTATDEQHQVLCLFPNRQSVEEAAKLLRSYVPVALWSSDLSPRATGQAWQLAKSGKALVVLGTRSALFAPLPALARVFIFQNHDDGHRSWDQQPTYDVRELVAHLAHDSSLQFFSCGVTPLLPSPTATKVLHITSQRHCATRIFEPQRMGLSVDHVAEQLALEIGNAVSRGRALVYDNRLGGAIVACADCRTLITCQNCTQVYVQPEGQEYQSGQWQCPRCLQVVELPKQCRTCGHTLFQVIASVSAKIRQRLRQNQIRVVELNASLMSNAAGMSKMFDYITSQKNVVVLATSFIISRLWFLPLFDETFALNAEHAFAAPSWRANEMALEALATIWSHTRHQITFHTHDQPPALLKILLENRMAEYMTQEASVRRRFSYPPFATLIKLSGTTPAPTNEELTTVLPSETLLTETTRGKMRTFILKVPSNSDLTSLWAVIPEGWRVDINPTDMS